MNPSDRDHKLHESQPPRPYMPEEPYRDDNLEGIRRAEGSGTMRRVDMKQMPKPLRYFGYAVAAFLCLGTLVLLLSDWLT